MERPGIVLQSANGVWRVWVPGGHHASAVNGTNHVWWWEWGTVCAEIGVDQR